MIQQTLNEIVTPELVTGAIINNEFPGFPDDYKVLHCLIRKYKPKTFFEIGGNRGTGTRIIKNAIGEGAVYSLDLPFGLGDANLYSDDFRGGRIDRTWINCNLPFTPLRGDSMTFDYSKYPCDGYFIDGEHDYEHPFHETKEILKCKPKLIVWHDLHVVPVQEAIRDAFKGNTEYELYRVNGTRIAYALNKEL